MLNESWLVLKVMKSVNTKRVKKTGRLPFDNYLTILITNDN